MAAQQIIIDIDDTNMTAANWAGFLEMNPLNESAPEDVSSVALKIAYIKTKLTAHLNFQIKRGRQLKDGRAASAAVANVDLNA